MLAKDVTIRGFATGSGKGDGVVTASGPGAASWDLASGAVIEQIRHPGEKVTTALGVSFKTEGYSFGLRARSPDRRFVSAFGFAPGELYRPAKIAVIAWDSFTGKKFLQLIPQDSTALASNGNAVAFSPDGKLLATCWESPPIVKLWDTATGLELKQLAGHSSAVDAVAFNRDGNRLVTGARGTDKSMIVWSVETGEVVLRIPVPEVAQRGSYVAYFKEVLFSSSGDRVLAMITATDGYKQLVVADAVSGQRVNFSQRAAVSCDVAQISPDGSRIIATCESTPSERGAIRVLDSSTGLELLAVPHERSPLAYGATARINPEGTLLVVGFEQRGQESVVLDGRSESDWKTRATERAARSTVAYFRGRTKTQDELVKAIQADATINEDVRAMAVRFASRPPPRIVELQP